MFRDLRVRISPQRRALAWVILALLLALGAMSVSRLASHPGMHQGARIVLWAALGFVAVRAATFLLVDPLMRQEHNATPGFARDMIVVVLYLAVFAVILREVVGVSLGRLLGTGALAAAVIGLSMQETLGNIFAGLSLSLDNAFQVGDWIEIIGTWQGGTMQESMIGRVEAMTWRAVQLVSEDGDTDLVPNRIMAQSLVTNLYAPAGFHRRTARFVIAPTARLHELMELLGVALAGIPHPSEQRPRVVVRGQEEGGIALEAQWWTLGFRHAKASTDEVNRLLATVLAREGYALMGPSGASPVPPPEPDPSEMELAMLVGLMGLPPHWVKELRGRVQRRRYAPGEGVLREGDPGDSIFAVLQGRVAVVRSETREEPHTGLFWRTLAELGRGDWLGEASLLTGAPRNATVVAATPCTLLEMHKEAFEASLEREPEILDHLAQLLLERDPDAGSREAAESGGSRVEYWTRQIQTWFGLR
ncbi:MAG TPA: mechanosensitive ion channel family protein [Holophagaceae bacterium]|nr:mechanosensitive ion channel family protein [Holophagaceae bacterium]